MVGGRLPRPSGEARVPPWTGRFWLVQRVRRSWRWVAVLAALVGVAAIPAVIGALPIFWVLLPLLLAVVLIVLSVLYARRGGNAS